MSRRVQYGIFEWDPEKDQENIVKHGISFSTATQVFLDPMGFSNIDPKHSQDEERCLFFGKLAGDVLTVRFTFRGTYVRILGAGFWRRGRKIYEKKENSKE